MSYTAQGDGGSGVLWSRGGHLLAALTALHRYVPDGARRGTETTRASADDHFQMGPDCDSRPDSVARVHPQGGALVETEPCLLALGPVGTDRGGGGFGDELASGSWLICTVTVVAVQDRVGHHNAERALWVSTHSARRIRAHQSHRHRSVEKVNVPRPDITFLLLDGTQAAAHADELQALHAEVYANPPYARTGDAALFADRFRVQCRQPGFVLVEARHGAYLVGYAAGMPLRPSTSWWRNLTTPLPGEVTTEFPGRTFALVDLLVRASWRRQGIAATLHDLILSNRSEERATLTVLPTAAPAQRAFQKWGWRKLARTGDPRRGSPVFDVLVTTLPAKREL